MTILIIIITVIVAILGLLLSINTLIETRKKYYNDYIQRKKKHEKN